MSTNVINIQDIHDRLATYMKGDKQLVILAEFTIGPADTINFTQRDVIPIGEAGPIIMMNNTVLNDTITDIRINYNDPAEEVDVTFGTNTEIYSYQYTDYKLGYQVNSVSFVPATVNKGSEGDSFTIFALSGNHIKIIFLIEQLGANLRNTMYQFLRYISLDNATGDWVDKTAESLGLRRLPGETDDELKQRIVSFNAPTDGTIESVNERVKVFLGLPDDTIISITESYNQEGWILNQSRLLDGGQSELIFTGSETVKPMQFIMTIPYSGTVTEEEVETFLEQVINVGATPIVRFS